MTTPRTGRQSNLREHIETGRHSRRHRVGTEPTASEGDVRSLRLPGSYKLKIRSLGKALSNFERLKTLDLSHNALFSIEGLKHLKNLQCLNLYYNCIPSLEEVKVLFELPVLRVLDLRLNPVANEHRYHPILVHAITSLRMLDACVVTHTERRAVRLLLSHDPYPRRKRAIVNQKSRDRTMAFVERLSKKLTKLTDEDDMVLSSPPQLPSPEEVPSVLNDCESPVPHRLDSNQIIHPPKVSSSSLNLTEDDGSYREPLEKLLDVMVKHWVGQKSLQIDSNFLIHIVQIFSMMEKHICKRDSQVKSLRNEVDALCFCTATQESEHKSDTCRLNSQLVCSFLKLFLPQSVDALILHLNTWAQLYYLTQFDAFFGLTTNSWKISIHFLLLVPLGFGIPIQNIRPRQVATLLLEKIFYKKYYFGCRVPIIDLGNLSDKPPQGIKPNMSSLLDQYMNAEPRRNVKGNVPLYT
ncbi:centrosomal protein of 72 kDa isoform X2 [Nerophis ophidion]|uniref:centrosomal protein of 72 kDa isoform X2 n=1 Tax=Nerophis ophidion TaxID=159077 RepID=UPI002AE06B65|nr:centrosomal protein of 72 kDa isoform X2 [Nerophis ophidion]